MVPWNKLPQDLQKTILAMIVVLGSASASCSLTGPVICDPAPPPSTTPMICDPPPPPITTSPPRITPSPTITPTLTATPSIQETPMICDPPPPPKTPMICDPPPAPPLDVTPVPQSLAPGQHQASSQAPLPLAEIRTVDIVWEDGLTFSAESPWPGARCRWSASGGTLVEEDERVTWQPPEQPGRYLLQVVADWGHTGMAVDALVIVVAEDGSVTLC